MARIVELGRLAHMAKERGELETSLQYESEAYRLCLQLSDAPGGLSFPSLVAARLYNMGQLHYWMGEVEEAKRWFEHARELDADARNLVGQAGSVRSLFFLCHEAGDLSGALELHKEGLQLDCEADFEYGIAVDRANIGTVYYELGDFQQALQYLGQALRSLEVQGRVQEAEKVRRVMQTVKSQMA